MKRLLDKIEPDLLIEYVNAQCLKPKKKFICNPAYDPNEETKQMYYRLSVFPGVPS